jgi:hypothetical protein
MWPLLLHSIHVYTLAAVAYVHDAALQVLAAAVVVGTDQQY